MDKWYNKSYRRYFLDFHIDDWNEEFLSEFDPEEYAESVKIGEGNAATVFANSHTGLCNYPTKTGKIHGNLKGRDLLREMIDCLTKRDISVVIYYCTIYVNQYWEDHPDSRIVDIEGNSNKLKINCSGNPKRFSVCCLNNKGYRSFIIEQLKELCENYQFEGLWIDMTFWPTVCYCQSCREKYHSETGLEIPKKIDWLDKRWTNFQKTRQKWLYEFWKLITCEIHNIKQNISIVHQSQTFIWDWLAGGSVELAQETDWLSADLYGDRYILSYSGKIFYELSKNKPFERINCWNVPNIHEHIITRKQEEMMNITFSTFMNNGAMVVIDQIDPIGSIHKQNYTMMHNVFNELKKYESYSGGDFCQDVAIYYSLTSNFDIDNKEFSNNTEFVFAPGRKNQSNYAHVNSTISVAKSLIMNHMPYGVITKKSINSLYKYNIIILSNVIMLDMEEIQAFKQYVAGGGNLYVSKFTSMIDSEGKWHDDFQLSELLGVSYIGITHEPITYISPKNEYSTLFPKFSKTFPVTLNDQQLIVETNNSSAEILATLTLPYIYPAEDRHGSMLTDPPGTFTSYPSVILNKYGKGTVIYSSGVLESSEHDSQRDVFIHLIRRLLTRPLSFTTDAHKAIEITRFDQLNLKRTILHVLNFQNELPNIPVNNISIKLYVGKNKVDSVSIVPTGEELNYIIGDETIECSIPVLQTYSMLSVTYL